VEGADLVGRREGTLKKRGKFTKGEGDLGKKNGAILWGGSENQGGQKKKDVLEGPTPNQHGCKGKCKA